MIQRGRSQVIKTYRYLRMSMVLLSVALAAAVVLEVIRSDLVLTSVSAYYYTPAKAMFVAALVAIGVGLIALRGNTDPEDILLNLAGMFAPIVAFVPTPRGSATVGTVNHIVNNVTAYFVAGLVAVLSAAAIAMLQKTDTGARKPLSPGDLAGLAVAFVTLVAGWVWLGQGRDSFVYGAHYTAAVLMFGFIALAVMTNTGWGSRLLVRAAGRFSADDSRAERWDPQRDGREHFSRAYTVIFSLMLLTQLAWTLKGTWSHTVLFVEIAMITLFAVFWTLQTYDLRDTDLEPEAA